MFQKTMKGNGAFSFAERIPYHISSFLTTLHPISAYNRGIERTASLSFSGSSGNSFLRVSQGINVGFVFFSRFFGPGAYTHSRLFMNFTKFSCSSSASISISSCRNRNSGVSQSQRGMRVHLDLSIYSGIDRACRLFDSFKSSGSSDQGTKLEFLLLVLPCLLSLAQYWWWIFIARRSSTP